MIRLTIISRNLFKDFPQPVKIVIRFQIIVQLPQTEWNPYQRHTEILREMRCNWIQIGLGDGVDRGEREREREKLAQNTCNLRITVPFASQAIERWIRYEMDRLICDPCTSSVCKQRNNEPLIQHNTLRIGRTNAVSQGRPLRQQETLPYKLNRTKIAIHDHSAWSIFKINSVSCIFVYYVVNVIVR